MFSLVQSNKNPRNQKKTPPRPPSCLNPIQPTLWSFLKAFPGKAGGDPPGNTTVEYGRFTCDDYCRWGAGVIGNSFFSRNFKCLGTMVLRGTREPQSKNQVCSILEHDMIDPVVVTSDPQVWIPAISKCQYEPCMFMYKQVGRQFDPFWSSVGTNMLTCLTIFSLIQVQLPSNHWPCTNLLCI